jgi:hypothetical protein
MLKLDFLGRYDVADMVMLAASVVVIVSNRDLSCQGLPPWREKTQGLAREAHRDTR